MAIFFVTWDLNKQRQNYNQARQNLINHLARYDHVKDPGLDSVSFISSKSSPDAISADIRTRMDDNDKLMVTKLVQGQHQGWLQKDIWNWINVRL